MALKFNFLEWLTKRRTSLYPKLTFDLRCNQCKRQFKRKLRRVYVELNVYDKRQLDHRRPRHSEFIIPETITCPKCQAVNQVRVTATAYHHLSKMPLMTNNGVPSPHTPIQCIRFMLRDGRQLHPYEALNRLVYTLEKSPEDNPARVEYANLLRMLGRYDESEAEFLKVLEIDPLEPEALLNMAVFHGKRAEKDQAVSYLFKVEETAEHSPHPDHALFVEAVQHIMDGVIQMEEIELTAPMLFDIDPAIIHTTRFYRPTPDLTF
ncbi:MAG: hypothetical protein AAF629_28130 [Chloroflexota bacterium]